MYDLKSDLRIKQQESYELNKSISKLKNEYRQSQ